VNALGCRVYCAVGVFGAIVACAYGLWWFGLPLAFFAGSLFENAIVQDQHESPRKR
jgi:hypothetical protein